MRAMPRPALTARVLSEAMPYLRAYRGKAIVVRFGGRAMEDPQLKAAFARDVALLRLVGMKPIVVHGGGWRIDELMRTMGITPTRHIAAAASPMRRRSTSSRWSSTSSTRS
jgi:acetylglutamate kinase